MAEEVPAVNLRILSPSTELQGGLSFPNLPAATTIQELRTRIQDTAPSKPAPDRMRLIYRGRVIANDADTLATVFGAESMRETKDQSLHLVLRELPSTDTSSPSPAPRPMTVPPNPFRPVQAATPANPLQTNPFRTLPQPQAPPHHHHHHGHHHPVPGPIGAFQVPLPPLVQQNLERMAQDAPDASAAHRARVGGADPQAAGPQLPPMGLPPPPGWGPPNPPNLPPSGRTVRQDGVGPNGERWSVTYSNINIPVQLPHHVHPHPMPPPGAFGLPPLAVPSDSMDRMLPQLRQLLTNANRELDNVRTLLRASASPGSHAESPLSAIPPAWRLGHIRQNIQMIGRSLSLIERGLNFAGADAQTMGHPDWVSLRQSTNELRGHLDELNQMLDRQDGIEPAPGQAPATGDATSSPAFAAPTSAATQSTQPQAHMPSASPTLPANAPEELFILSSPQGPVGILFDQRGTYTTAPMVSTLPFQTFTNQFAQNRQFIAGLGQQIAQSTNQVHNQLGSIQPTPIQQPADGGQPQARNQAPVPHQDQVPVQNQDVNGAANPPAADDRVGNIAGHLWLLLKLACFVYFFSGGGGWYKSIVLGLIAGVVYLAQLGIFQEQFNIVRRHFEAVLPVGALAERVAQPRNANTQAQRPQPNTTPEEMARRLLQQRQDQRFSWVRESMRAVERSFAIFVASLWPGIGERMVHAQEERVRAERVAEEERQQQEEESRRHEAEARQRSEEAKEETSAGHESGEPGPSPKGKERAEQANVEEARDDTA